MESRLKRKELDGNPTTAKVVSNRNNGGMNLSSSKAKVIVVFGVRPEAIKMAPVVKSLQMDPNLETIVAVTGQHREMLDQVLQHFSITPMYDLNIMKPRQTLTDITISALSGLEKVFHKENPDLCLVHGDTSTTFVASVAAFYRKVPVGHVEAGLRTHDKWLPYPEEMNRRLVGAIADVHFAPTEHARLNLLAEGVRDEQIYVTGNTAIDALLMTVVPGHQFGESRIEDILGKGRVLLAEVHRRENWGQPIRHILQSLREIVRSFHDVQLLYSVHANPEVSEPVNEILAGEDRVHLFRPIPYADYANLIARSHLVLTDSGGLQEEAPSLGKPVIVFREETERPEALEAGTVTLVGADSDRIIHTISNLLNDPDAYAKMATATNPYGDGLAAKRIAKAVSTFLNGNRGALCGVPGTGNGRLC